MTADPAIPNPLFDRDWYMARNPDVAAKQADAWQHFLAYGAQEGRDPNPVFDSNWYLSRYPEVRAAGLNPLLHYWHVGAAQGYDPNPLFDSDWYLARYSDVCADGVNPLLHYLHFGAIEGRDPCAQFDANWYLRANPDIQPGSLTALGDYLRYGQMEGRSIAPPNLSVENACGSTRAPHAKPAGRIAVYTAIAADYDCLKIPTEIDPDCDYYCFTDRDIGWQDVWIRREFTWHHDDPARVSRQVKHLPHEYFPDHEWSIWIDANLQLNCAPPVLMPQAPQAWDFACWRHPFRDCLYAEATACVREGKDDPATIQAQIERYREQDFPEHAGLMENNVLVRRHHAPALIDLAQAWWEEISRGSRRDQLSFPIVAAQRSLRIALLGPDGNNARNDPRLRFYSHTLPRPAWSR